MKLMFFEDGIKLYISKIWSIKIEYFIGKSYFCAENDAPGDELG
jgi:hypothetical protein